MKYFTVDPRDGYATASCSTCCCQTVIMRPGETDKFIINYAPWSVPLGNGAVLVPEFDFDFEYNTTCSTANIDGFGPPAAPNLSLATSMSTVLSIDVTQDVTPVGNAFTYRKLPLSGPNHGTLAPVGPAPIDTTAYGSGNFIYTPDSMFVGYDSFDYEIKDNQGRIVIATVTITVGTPPGVPVPVHSKPFIDRSQVHINQRLHTVDFPLTMPSNARPCDSWRLLVKAKAQDCNRNVYTHFSCYDIIPGKC